MRTVLAALAGLAVLAAAAVVLGDYPLSLTVMVSAAVLIPLAIGLVMTAIARHRRRLLWACTGPLAAGSVAWGVAIATGWGLDPVPASAWLAGAAALLWPPAWAALAGRRDGVGGESEGDRSAAAGPVSER